MRNRLPSILLAAAFMLMAMAAPAQKAAQKPVQKQKVGVVLSGGGALGFAHIGMLQALEDYGIKPTIVSGTSMGALVGAMYANGMSPMEIFDMVVNEGLDKIFSIVNLNSKIYEDMGLSSHKKLRAVLSKYLPHDSFEQLEMPFYLCSTNLTDSKEAIVSSGDNLIDNLLGSASIPGVFSPVDIGGKLYIDGGVYNNLPAQPIRRQCTILIASDVNPANSRGEIKNAKDVVMRAMSLLIYENTREGRKMCDYVIDLPVNRHYSTMDFKKFYSIYQIGYSTSLKYLKEHPDLVRKAKSK